MGTVVICWFGGSSQATLNRRFAACIGRMGTRMMAFGFLEDLHRPWGLQVHQGPAKLQGNCIFVTGNGAMSVRLNSDRHST